MTSLHTALIPLFAAATLATAAPMDQSGPDASRLAGHWVWLPNSPTDRPLVSFCGLECVISYENGTLTVMRIGSTGVQRYALDGTPLKHTSEFGQYRAEVTTTARWNGTTLALTRATGSQPPRLASVTTADGLLRVRGDSTGRGGQAREFVFAPKTELLAGTQQTTGRPNFSGRWTMMNPDPASNQIPPACSLECVIVQDQETLSVRRVDADVDVTYRLDGLPVSTTSEALGRKVVTTVRAYWKDRSLVIERTTGSGDEDESRPPVVTTVTLEGERLVFERVRPGSGRGSAPARFVYERAK